MGAARKPLLITFDVEEFDWPVERGRTMRPATQLHVTHRGLHLVLPLLERHGVRATFFVTGTFAQAYPHTVGGLVAAGHEAAVHGLAHADDYARLASALAVDRLRTARTLVEQASGQPPMGVRTPRLRPCPAAILRAAGFLYDTSAHPTWMPGRYNGLRWPRTPWWDDGLLRVPISVVPWIRAPVSWIWYRSAGAVLGGAAARVAALRAPYLQLYFHPWEALDLRHFGIPWWLAVRTGGRFLDVFEHLLRWGSRRFEPMPVAEFVRRGAGSRVDGRCG